MDEGSIIVREPRKRQPALIPSDASLSSDDERSIELRIGNLQLASVDKKSLPQRTQARRQGVKDALCSGEIIPSPEKRSLRGTWRDDQGTKRKASTTAEQYRQLSYGAEVQAILDAAQDDGRTAQKPGVACSTKSTFNNETPNTGRKSLSCRQILENLSPKSYREPTVEDDLSESE